MNGLRRRRSALAVRVSTDSHNHSNIQGKLRARLRVFGCLLPSDENSIAAVATLYRTRLLIGN